LPFRYRGSRRESAVAQLFSLGHITHHKNMKTNKHVIRLLGVVSVFAILSWITTGTAKGWFEDLTKLASGAFLVVILVGMVAERRKLEAKRKAETGV
jgi:hypothetical protein